MSATAIKQIADQLKAATDAAQSAADYLEKQKAARRNARWWRRLRNFFSTTFEAQTQAEIAAKKLSSVTQRARERTELWVNKRVENLIKKKPSAHTQFRELESRRRVLINRLDQMSRWSELVVEAINSLEDAVDECHSKSTDFLDIDDDFDDDDIEDKDNALFEASQAVKAFIRAIPKRTKGVDFGDDDDLLEFLVSFVRDPEIEVVSWFNMRELDDVDLDDVEDKCEDTIRQLSSIHQRIERSASAAERQLEAIESKIEKIKKPYLKSAKAELPETLRIFADETRTAS